MTNLTKDEIQDKLARHSKTIKFLEEEHEYWYNAKKFESVTGRISLFEKTFDSVKIASKIAAKNENIKYKDLDYLEILKLWDDELDRAVEKGRWVHRFAEQFSLGAETRETDNKIFKLYEKQIRKLFKRRALDVVSAETIVYDTESCVAGTIDMISLNNDGTLTLWDWKTNKYRITDKNPYNDFLNAPLNKVPATKYGVYSLQLFTYKRLLEKLGFKVSDANIVYLTSKRYEIIAARDFSREADIVLNHKFK